MDRINAAAGAAGPRDSNAKVRLHVSNIPYDLRWQDLKDLFKDKVGSEICYVEIYEGLDGKPSGVGVIEVKSREVADRAIELLHRSDLKGRQIVVREEKDKDRVNFKKCNNFIGGQMETITGMGMNGGGMGMNGGGMGMNGGGMGMNGSGMGMNGSGMGMNGSGMGMNGSGMGMNGSGIGGNGMLSNGLQLLCQLGIEPETITNQVFVANLDYSVTVKKLKEVFQMAGNILQSELKLDKEGNSRGMATVRYKNPIEAVQAVAMFNGQFLFERQMSVRMDKMAESTPQVIPNKLPQGLKGFGFGLGCGGQPFMNIGEVANLMTLSNLVCLMSGKSSIGGPIGDMNGAGYNNMRSNMRNFGNMNGNGGGNSLNNDSMMNNIGNNMVWGGLDSVSSGAMFGGGMGGRMSSSFGSRNGVLMNNYGANGYNLSGVNGCAGSFSRDHNIRGGSDSFTVFVRNLPFSTTWQDLKDKFKECGDIKFAEIKTENGKSRGCGTVRFSNLEDARRAISLKNGTRIEGRQIEVKLDV